MLFGAGSFNGMANSAEDICNQALGMVSEKEISSINDDTSTEAILCRTYFQQAWDEMLERVKPRAAQDEAILAQTSFTANSYQQAYRYQLPSEPNYCLQVLTTNGVQFKGSGNRLIGRLLESADSSMFIRFVFRTTKYGHMTAAFINAASYNLAIKLAVPLEIADSNRNRLIAELKDMVLPRAIAEENENDGAEDDIDHKSTWATQVAESQVTKIFTSGNIIGNDW